MTKRTCLLLMLVLGLASACGASQDGLGGGPRAWIDSPSQGSTLGLAPVEVAARARHPQGVAQIELWVNGAVVARSDNPEPGAEVYAAQLSWRPSTPGAYTLQVRALSAGGDWGPFTRADLSVNEERLEAFAAPSATRAAPTSTPLPTSAPTATLQPVESSLPTASPAPQAAPATKPAAPPAATATPEVVVVAVPTVGAKNVLGGPTFSTANLFYGDAGCGPQQVTFEVAAAPGADVAAVTIYFTLADKATGKAGGWSSLPMAGEGGRWVRTIAATAIPGHNNHRQAWLQFYFAATDSQGNQSKSVGYYTSITLARCG